MSEPDLSIVIPSYNRLSLLMETLESFVGKLTCSYEVVIVDDGSTDGTWEYLCSQKPPIRVFQQAHEGSNYARNRGLTEAKGKYIKFLDSDDLLNPANVDDQVEYMASRDDIDVCYSDITYWYESTNEKKFHQAFQVETPIDALLTNQWRGFLPHSCSVKNSVAREVRWSEKVKRHQEKDFLLRLAAYGASFAYLPGNAGLYRNHMGTRMTDGGDFELAQGQLVMYHQTEELLSKAGQLTDARRRMLANRYFECAERLYRADHRIFRKVVSEYVLRIDPTFESERPRFKQLARIIGLENAERIRSLVFRPAKPQTAKISR